MSADTPAAHAPRPTNGLTRAAGLLVAAEGIGVLALAVWQVFALLAGDTGSVVSAIALLVLTVIGAVVVLAFAVGILRGRSWGRSRAIVTQVLILAIALGAATGQYAHPLIGLVLAVPAIACLALVFLAARRSPKRDDVAG